MAPPLQAKVLLLGDSGVGKTCLRMRYIDNKFSQQFRTSIGLDFQFRATTALKGTPDQVDVNMQIMDTAGQERFRSLAKAFYRGVDACILCFSLADPQSLDHLKGWFDDFVDKTQADDGLQDICFVAVGTKNDLPSAVPTDKVLQQLDLLLPGSRAAKPDQLLVEASNPNSTPESMPRRQASTSNLRPKRSTSSLSSATASSSRTRKISTPSSDFTTSNYYTPQGSVSTLTPGSFSTTTLSPICASRHDDDDDDDSSELSRPPSPGSSSSRPISAYTVTEQADDTASTIGPPSEHGDETPQPGLEENIDHDTIYEAFNLFYTSAKTGESVSDPFEYVAEQLALRLREKRADQEFTKLDEQELEFAGLGFTLGNINSRAHLMLDNHQDENILPLKGRRGSRRGGCC